LVIVWLIAGKPKAVDLGRDFRSMAPVLVPLACFGVFSVLGTHDFMAFKRAELRAQDHLLHDLRVDPCHVDGGFEFNGYHCYGKVPGTVNGNSWWWVEKEDYLLTLGPLPGYEVVKTYPFKRFIGPNGEVFLLRPKAEKQ
jgi:hypothetical protein